MSYFYGSVLMLLGFGLTLGGLTAPHSAAGVVTGAFGGACSLLGGMVLGRALR